MIKVIVIAIALILLGIFSILSAEKLKGIGVEQHKRNMAKIGIRVFEKPPTKYPYIIGGVVIILFGIILILIAIFRN